MLDRRPPCLVACLALEKVVVRLDSTLPYSILTSNQPPSPPSLFLSSSSSPSPYIFFSSYPLPSLSSSLILSPHTPLLHAFLTASFLPILPALPSRPCLISLFLSSPSFSPYSTSPLFLPFPFLSSPFTQPLPPCLVMSRFPGSLVEHLRAVSNTFYWILLRTPFVVYVAPITLVLNC